MEWSVEGFHRLKVRGESLDLENDEWCGEPRCLERAKWWIYCEADDGQGGVKKYLLSFCDKHKDECAQYSFAKDKLCDRDKIEKLLIVKNI
jgi:hypothetical protein